MSNKSRIKTGDRVDIETTTKRTKRCSTIPQRPLQTRKKNIRKLIFSNRAGQQAKRSLNQISEKETDTFSTVKHGHKQLCPIEVLP